MLKQNRGSAVMTTPIIVAIGMFMVCVLVALVVEILIPYLWYEKLSATCIKYVYIMEEYGYLTSKEMSNMKSDFASQGFDISKLDFEYTNNRTDYGDPIFLKVSYDYELELPLMPNQNIEMKVERNSVSKI